MEGSVLVIELRPCVSSAITAPSAMRRSKARALLSGGVAVLGQGAAAVLHELEGGVGMLGKGASAALQGLGSSMVDMAALGHAGATAVLQAGLEKATTCIQAHMRGKFVRGAIGQMMGPPPSQQLD